MTGVQTCALPIFTYVSTLINASINFVHFQIKKRLLVPIIILALTKIIMMQA